MYIAIIVLLGLFLIRGLSLLVRNIHKGYKQQAVKEGIKSENSSEFTEELNRHGNIL